MASLSPSPLVSIVTPAYNSAHVIERTIASVMNQDYPRVEHIVIDGGSTDGTVDILRRYPHLRWISEPDRGQSNAINKGFRMAQGEVLAWLNADDTYNPGAISTAVQWLQSHSDVGLVHSDYHVIDEEDCHLYTLHAIDFELDQLFLTNEVPGQFTAFWHRYVLDRVGDLDEDLHYVMDYDYWLRIAMVFPVKHIPGPCLANFRYCPGTKTHSHPEAFRAEADRVVTRALESAAFAALSPSVQRRARASGLRHRAVIACYSNNPVAAAAALLPCDGQLPRSARPGHRGDRGESRGMRSQPFCGGCTSDNECIVHAAAAGEHRPPAPERLGVHPSHVCARQFCRRGNGPGAASYDPEF